MTPVIGLRPISCTFLLLAVLAVGVLSANPCADAGSPAAAVGPSVDPAAESIATADTDLAERPQADARANEPGEPDPVRVERSGSGQVLQVSVGPARAECYGPFRRMCLIVDGQFFYEEIDGFTHEPGYDYRLRIERYDAFPGQKEPPQDAGRFGYRLVEVISKTRAAGSVREVSIAPTRVRCPKSDERCLIVDGRPRRDSIDGFVYEPGFDYRLRLEDFDGGTTRVVEVLAKSPATAVIEEITVGPWRVGCYEDAPITAACIVVDGEPYFGIVEGHARRHGYDYRLRVGRYDLFPDRAARPPELPKYGYLLLDVLSERPATETPASN